VWRSRGGAGEEWVTEERTGVRARFEWLVGGAAEGEKGREGGVQPRECYGCCGAWPRPAGSGPSVARAGNVHHVRVAGRKQRGGDGQVGHGTVSGGGAADRRVWPVSRCRTESGAWCADARARVGQPDKEQRWAAQVNSKVLYLFELV
jgi:hypothetical protein